MTNEELDEKQEKRFTAFREWFIECILKELVTRAECAKQHEAENRIRQIMWWLIGVGLTFTAGSTVLLINIIMRMP